MGRAQDGRAEADGKKRRQLRVAWELGLCALELTVGELLHGVERECGTSVQTSMIAEARWLRLVRSAVILVR